MDALALALYLQYHNWELESVMHHSHLYILVTHALELAYAFLRFIFISLFHLWLNSLAALCCCCLLDACF
jgi:ABC-type lipoprotein release transport system permease subunit